MSKLVSILTPTYNNEKQIERLLLSILKQTYKNIEFIIINDGSTDNTLNIIRDYQKIFNNEGIELIILSQENKGQAAAINKGLKIFSGDYFCWVDADDWLDQDSIKKKVSFLEKNESYGFVRSDGYITKKPNLENNKLDKFSNHINLTSSELFYDLLYVRNIYFTGAGYMARRNCILNAIPNLHINESREGQNWQILLPLSIEYRCGYINEPLFYYYDRPDSHSHSVNEMNKEIIRCDNHKKLVTDILTSIKNVPINNWDLLLDDIYNRKKLGVYYFYGDIQNIKIYFNKIRNKKIKDYIKYFYFILK